MKKDAFMNFLADLNEGRLTLQPTDVLTYGWVGENMYA